MKGENDGLAKINRPRFSLTYHRSCLYNLLDELYATPLIMVNGLPGAGKTTLIAGYAESRKIPCLWYQMDQNDADLSAFFFGLNSAALAVNPENGALLPRLPPEHVLGVPSVTKKYFHKLYQYLETPFLIVLDDYQEIPKGAVLHEVIKDACAELPHGGRMILISRYECPLTASGPSPACATAVIGDEELQLSPDEAKGIAALHGMTIPSDERAHQLLSKTGGWAGNLVAALQDSHAAMET